MVTTTSTRSTVALLAVVTGAMLATVIAADMVNLVLPSIGEEFAAQEAELAWVVTGFLLVFAIGIPFYGRLSDRVGLRRLFVLALAAYVVGSAVAAIAPTLLVLVAGRVVMGAGAAAVPVLSIVAVTRLVPVDRRGTAIGVVSAAAGVGTAAGPALGGGLGELWGWRALFWLMVVVAALLIPAALKVLPDDHPGGRGRIDLPSGVLLGLATGLLLLGITQGQVSGFSAPASWVSLVVAVLAAGLLIWRTVRVDEPFVPPALFANREFRAAVTVVFLAMAVNLGALVLVALLVVDVNGLSPGEGALVMVPAGVAVAVLSPLIGRTVDRVGTRSLVIAGAAVMALFALVLSAFAGTESVVPVGVGLLGLSAGFIMVLTPMISAVANLLEPAELGVGIGILQGAQFLGAGTGPALLGVLVAARQRDDGEAFNPLHLGEAAAAYADAFLLMAVVALLALVAAVRMRAAR